MFGLQSSCLSWWWVGRSEGPGDKVELEYLVTKAAWSLVGGTVLLH